MSYYIYQTISPIDQFLGCCFLSELLEKEKGHISAYFDKGNYYYADEIKSQYKEAEKAAIKAGCYIEELRHEPLVFSIPDTDFNCRLGFIFKEDNNGNTFVASPFRLVHLENNA